MVVVNSLQEGNPLPHLRVSGSNLLQGKSHRILGTMDLDAYRFQDKVVDMEDHLG
jgi:hypothetical protein